MTILNSLDPVIDFEVNSWALFSDFQSNLEQLLVKLNTYGTGRKEIKSFKIEEITSDNFQINKLNGLIQNIVFKNTSPIDGQLPLISDLEQGSAFLLYNKASTPGTNTVTITLNGSLEISGDTSIVLNSNSYAVLLILTDKVNSKYTKYILDSKHIDSLLSSNNTWSGTNNFTGSVDIASLSLGSGGTTSGLEIGNSSSSGGLSFIDMKFGIGSAQDFNVRYLVNGNESFLCSTATKNIYSFNNGSFNFGVHLYPTADGVLNIGSASLRVNEYWGVNGAIQTSMEDQKDEIEDLEIGLDFILELKPKHYKMKNISEKTQKVKKYRKKINEILFGTKKIQTIGLEEYEEDEIIPEVKYTRKHTGLSTKDVKRALDKFGISTMNFAGYIKDKITGLEGLRYIEFIPILIKSIQDQNKIIQDLKNELQDLKNNV